MAITLRWTDGKLQVASDDDVGQLLQTDEDGYLTVAGASSIPTSTGAASSTTASGIWVLAYVDGTLTLVDITSDLRRIRQLLEAIVVKLDGFTEGQLPADDLIQAVENLITEAN